ncbi:MAG: peptidylprolyl isomerase [Planctomycetota bacterium]
MKRSCSFILFVGMCLVACDKVSLEASSQEDGSTQEAASKGKQSEDKAVAKIQEFIESSSIDQEKDNWRRTLPLPPKVEFDPKHEYFWKMKTNKGEMLIKLMPDVAPMHVSSTLYLLELGFYDGLKFHRVIPGFMAQGGDPIGNGTGSPGYRYDGEFDPKVRHDRGGLLSMANAGPGTDGSQFFLTFVPTKHLNDKHTIFGEVVEGKDTLRKLEAAGTQGGRTTENLIMEKNEIVVRPKG